jgi:hypothetical protein
MEKNVGKFDDGSMAVAADRQTLGNREGRRKQSELVDINEESPGEQYLVEKPGPVEKAND